MNDTKIKEIRVFNIDWCVEEEDVMDNNEWWSRIDEVSDEEMNAAIEKIKSELPTEDSIPVMPQDNLDIIAFKISDIADWLSDKHGWLVNSYEYELIDTDGNPRRLELV